MILKISLYLLTYTITAAPDFYSDGKETLVIPSSHHRFIRQSSHLSEDLVYDEIGTLEHTLTKEGYKVYGNYSELVDQAAVVSRDSTCFAVFRGTTGSKNPLRWANDNDDWQTNYNPYVTTLCSRDVLPRYCCRVRSGFLGSYANGYRLQLEDDVERCIDETCPDSKDCLVLTGHSQGGASAVMALFFWSKYRPYVVTFGQPPAIEYDTCSLSSVYTDRIYRFINIDEDETFGQKYDAVGWLTNWKPEILLPSVGNNIVLPYLVGAKVDLFGTVSSSFEHFGHLITLGTSGAAYYGENAQSTTLVPTVLWNPTAHFGYSTRIPALFNSTDDKSIQGFGNGSPCTSDDECRSGRCDFVGLVSKRCLESGKAASCDPCNEDSDCSTNNCKGIVNRQCANKDNKWEIGCECTFSGDCASGRCDGGECVPRESESCARCNENSDCASNYCYNTVGQCANFDDKMDGGCSCIFDGDCASGHCDSVSLFSKKCRNGSRGPCAFCLVGSDCDSGHCHESVSRCANENNLLENGCSCLRRGQCESGRCDKYKCKRRLPSCSKCKRDSDCQSDFCHETGLCSGAGGLMDVGCSCSRPSDCRSGNCISLDGSDNFVCVVDDHVGGCISCLDNNDCPGDDTCNMNLGQCWNSAGTMNNWCKCQENTDCLSNLCEIKDEESPMGYCLPSWDYDYSPLRVVQIGDSYGVVGARNDENERQYEGPVACYRSSFNWGSLYYKWLRDVHGFQGVFVNRACQGGVIADFHERTHRDDFDNGARICFPGQDRLSITPAQVLEKAEAGPCASLYPGDEQVHAEFVRMDLDSPCAWVKCMHYMQPQLDAVRQDTDMVLLTGGGNDVKFGDVVFACFVPFS